jgi:hypothetical protein
LYYRVFLLTLFFLLAHQASALTISPPTRELSGDPGQTISGTIKLYNETGSNMQFFASTMDFTAKEGEGGDPLFLEQSVDEKNQSHSLASWIKVPDWPIDVKSQEFQAVTFEIDIPSDAEPGGHYAAVFFAPQTVEVGGPGSVGINYQTGSLILITVSGDIREEGGVKEFKTKNYRKFYEHLPVIMELRLENTGNVHFRPKESSYVEIRNIFGQKLEDLPVNKSETGGNVLPQSIRRYEIIWGDANEKNWPQGFWDKVKYEWNNFYLGRYSAKAIVELPQGVTDVSQIYFWIIPWQLLIFIILGLIILILLFRQYNRWIIKKARESKE